MNWELFFTIIAWVGVVGSGVVLALMLALVCYAVFTESGRREEAFNMAMGRTSTYPLFFPSFSIFIVSIALLVSL